MFQNGQKVVVVSSGDPARVIKVQAVSDGDASRYPIVDTTGVSGRDQSVQIVSGGDPTRFPQLRGLATARDTADSVITALTPAAWYRNATGVTSAGGFASQWDDYSGNTRHLVQATGTNQPAYAAGVFTFDGADNYMDTGAFAINQGHTIVAVCSQVSWTSAGSLWDGKASGASALLYQVGSTPNLTVYAGADGPANTGATIGARKIIVAVYNGASSVSRINNAADATGNAGANNGNGFRLGARGGVATAWANATFEEVILFPSALSDANRTAVITALNNALTVF